LKTQPNNFFPLPGDERMAIKKRKRIPYEFVLDAIASLSPRTHAMFGCHAVYVRNKIVFILREKETETPDNGLWLATTDEHHESLRREFPAMRSIQVFGGGTTGWQVLPAGEDGFEEAAMRACELVLAGDPRIGKIPGTKRPAKPGSAKKVKVSKRVKKMKRTVRRPSSRKRATK
jgi:hypothetical protein